MKKEFRAKEIPSGREDRKRSYESPRLTEIGRVDIATLASIPVIG